jgi:hypothetical protein
MVSPTGRSWIIHSGAMASPTKSTEMGIHSALVGLLVAQDVTSSASSQIHMTS